MGYKVTNFFRPAQIKMIIILKKFCLMEKRRTNNLINFVKISAM